MSEPPDNLYRRIHQKRWGHLTRGDIWDGLENDAVRPGPVFASARDRRTVFLLATAVIIISMVGFWYIGRIGILTDPMALRSWLLEFGLLAPVAFIALQAIQVIVAPIPGQVLGVVSGYLFGAVLGTLYSILGATIGTWIALSLARRFGRPFVERVLNPSIVDRFDRLAGEQGLLAMFLVFLIPGIPDDVICFVAGVTELDVRKLLVVSIVGRLPVTVLANMAGASIAATRYVEAAAIIGVLLLAAGYGLLRRERVFTWIESR
jgi:uncharacterized membrane protein YdjX (TVP38/TMEM64 family)